MVEENIDFNNFLQQNRSVFQISIIFVLVFHIIDDFEQKKTSEILPLPPLSSMPLEICEEAVFMGREHEYSHFRLLKWR